METVLIVSLRTLLGFVLMLVLTRLLGQKQISQMSFFTYITGISLGNIAAEMAVNRDVSILSGVAALLLWSVLTIIVELISLRSSKARVALDGQPAIVIKRGVIQQNVMKRLRLNMDDLSMMLRNNNAFSFQDIDYAIMEPNGKLSVLKKPLQENITKGDMQIQAQSRMYMPTEIIVDGRIVMKNLREVGLTQVWLTDQLRSFGIESPDEVLLAELQSDGNLFVEKKTAEREG
ncbi:MAG TPA: DUF421 domain-containing protein [Bacillales bacterium]|nr:DUF421 domain-containing protein [Bacillales bacterium]